MKRTIFLALAFLLTLATNALEDLRGKSFNQGDQSQHEERAGQ